jgi:chromosome segregation protein
MLKELEIFGFKSFADKIKLVFPRPNEENFGITAIVGPNGSGKSNIVEAIQWVLGEQGHKTLRSHNSQDLIFSGSPLRARADYAEVGITLENKTNKDIWPLVEIKRRL